MVGDSAFFFQGPEHKPGIDRISCIAEPPAGIAKSNPIHAGLNPEFPAIAGALREQAFDPIDKRRRLNHVELRMVGEHLIVNPADPVAAGADFAIRQRRKVRPERTAKVGKDLLHRFQRDAAD